MKYDKLTPWTDNDINEKRTMPRDFKKPVTPQPAAATNRANLLSTQIAYKKQQEDVKTQQHVGQYSTPLTTKPPDINHKLSPIDKIGPVTRISTQILVPIDENEESLVKRFKTDDNKSEFNSINEEVCISTIDDIQEDVFTY